MKRGAWWATVHGVAKSQTRFSDQTTKTGVWDIHPQGNTSWSHVILDADQNVVFLDWVFFNHLVNVSGITEFYFVPPWLSARLSLFQYTYYTLGLMLKLKLHYCGHLMWTADSLEKSLLLGKTEGRRRRGCQRTKGLDGITNAMDMNLGKLQEWWGTGRPGMLQSMALQRLGYDWATEQQQNHYIYHKYLDA